MEIRKSFKFEMAHIVRNAWSKRCAYNIHGHSYIVEVFLQGDDLDNGQMLVDFGLVKASINDFLDSFDHTFMLWNREIDDHITKFAVENFERVIITPFSSSAEQQAVYFLKILNQLLKKYEKENHVNGAKNFEIHKVRVHETTTGYAEATLRDSNKVELLDIKNFGLNDFNQIQQNRDVIYISDQIIYEWKGNKSKILNYNK